MTDLKANLYNAIIHREVKIMEKRKRAPSAAQTRAATKYNATHTKQVPLRFNLETDKDILARFEEVGNVQGYIKQLIRADIEKG